MALYSLRTSTIVTTLLQAEAESDRSLRSCSKMGDESTAGAVERTDKKRRRKCMVTSDERNNLLGTVRSTQ